MASVRAPLFWAWVAIVTVSVLANHWLLRRTLFFYSDDWPWLWRAEFVEWARFFAPLPSDLYNDRPVGAAAVKLMYQWFNLDHRSFAIVLLALHAVNCVLLFEIARRYVGRVPALLAAVLATTWFSTLNALVAPANIFDLLGATFCLVMVRCRQLAADSGRLAYDIAGGLAYILAIRTKEFAIGMVAVILLLNLILERRRIRTALRESAPYLVVFVVYFWTYLQLVTVQAPVGDNPYRLHIDFPTLLSSLRFFWSVSFYNDIVGPMGVIVSGSGPSSLATSSCSVMPGW